VSPFTAKALRRHPQQQQPLRGPHELCQSSSIRWLDAADLIACNPPYDPHCAAEPARSECRTSCPRASTGDASAGSITNCNEQQSAACFFAGQRDDCFHFCRWRGGRAPEHCRTGARDSEAKGQKQGKRSPAIDGRFGAALSIDWHCCGFIGSCSEYRRTSYNRTGATPHE